MREESPIEIYSSLLNVWPENNTWYNYTHNYIIDFIIQNMSKRLNEKSIYLNAGSGGSTYNLPGTCYHVDIAENLIKNLTNYTVASIEELPYTNSTFDAVICVGSVINYCDVAKSISELSRVLKPGGYLVLEYERSNTGELWFSKDYGKGITIQRYDYLEHTHTLWLYSEHIINQLLKENMLLPLKNNRFHCLSAIINRIFRSDDYSGKFSIWDPLLKPISYISAHNAICLCQKSSFRL